MIYSNTGKKRSFQMCTYLLELTVDVGTVSVSFTSSDFFELSLDTTKFNAGGQHNRLEAMLN